MLYRLEQPVRSFFDRLRTHELTTKQFGVLVAIFSLPVIFACWHVAPLHLAGYALLQAILLLTLLFLVSCFPVRVSTEQIGLCTTLPIAMATNYLFGPFCATLISMVAMLGSVIYMQRLPRSIEEWRRFGWACLINIPMVAVSIGLPTLAYHFLLQLHLFTQHTVWAAVALSLVCIAEFYINAAMVTTLASLWTHTRWDVVWYNNYRWTWLSTILLSPLGFLMGALTEQNLGYGLAFILLPLLAVHQGYARHERQLATYRQGIELLGRLMQESHPYTHGHLNRVAGWAIKIAERLNLPAESLTQIENAAILHDIGKIAIDDRILNKVEKLTDEEWAKIKEHPVIGAEIAAKMKYLDQVSLWIRHHHERIDGKGYPDKLEGEEIPIEARIICVVDAFDAMVGGPSKADQRTYRAPKTLEEARSELTRCSGTQFDGRVVDVFIAILDEEAIEAAEKSAGEPMSLISSLGRAAAEAINSGDANVRLRTAA